MNTRPTPSATQGKKPKRLISRRRFIRIFTIGAGGGILWWSNDHTPTGLWNYLRWNGRRLVSKTLFGGHTRVAIQRVPTYDSDILGNLRDAWLNVDSPDVKGKRVVIKPNIIDYAPDRYVNTHLKVIEATIALMQEKGAKEVILAEGSAFRRDMTDNMLESGIYDMLDKYNAHFVDLNHDDLVEVKTKGQYTEAKSFLFPRTVVEADLLISLAKLKTHHWAGVSLSLKNLYGVVPGLKYGWPKNTLHVHGLTENILELYDTIAPQIAIVDGIIGMEGDGPVNGTEKHTGVLVVGSDLVAVDSVCARIMGFVPKSIRHIELAEWAGLGVSAADRITLVGNIALEKVQQNFQSAPRLTPVWA